MTTTLDHQHFLRASVLIRWDLKKKTVYLAELGLGWIVRALPLWRTESLVVIWAPGLGCSAACGILTSWSGIEPVFPCIGVITAEPTGRSPTGAVFSYHPVEAVLSLPGEDFRSVFDPLLTPSLEDFSRLSFPYRKVSWQEYDRLLAEIWCLVFQFSSVAQSCPTLCTPWTAVHQASLSITNS